MYKYYLHGGPYNGMTLSHPHGIGNYCDDTLLTSEVLGHYDIIGLCGFYAESLWHVNTEELEQRKARAGPHCLEQFSVEK